MTDSPGVRQAPMTYPDLRGGRMRVVGKYEKAHNEWLKIRVYVGRRKAARA